MTESLSKVGKGRAVAQTLHPDGITNPLALDVSDEGFVYVLNPQFDSNLLPGFGALNLVPFDICPVDLWLDDDHARVFDPVSPHLDAVDTSWLRRARRPLAA